MAEVDTLNEEQGKTQNPSRLKEIEASLKLIYAELDMIERTFVILLGLNILNEITEDKKPDTIPPVVTLNGSANVTIERGDYILKMVQRHLI